MCTFFPHAKQHGFAMSKHAFAELTEVTALLLQEENMRKAKRSVCLSLSSTFSHLCVCAHAHVCASLRRKGKRKVRGSLLCDSVLL